MATTDSSVLHIVSAFTRSLDIFKNLRERRREKKSSKIGRSHGEHSGDELRLSKSLRQGPVDIQQEYEKHYKTVGDRYAIGDPIAQASLAQTIRRLNTGLVNFISSLLSCDKKDAQIDYRFLTSLSDISRHEALDTLSQLSYRMSRSALSLNPKPRLPAHTRQTSRGGKENRGTGAGKSNSKHQHKRNDSKDVKSSRNRSHSRDGETKKPVIRRVQLSNSSNTTLVIVRPRTQRTTSGSSSSRSSTQPPSSPPPPAYSSQPTSPHHSPHPSTSTTTSPPLPPLPPHCQNTFPVQIPRDQHADLPYHYHTKRRQDKITPSMYTFASDSTKLGEISMNRWNIPYDYEGMAKRNQEVPLRPWTSEEPPVRVKRGFFGLFKKSGGGGA
ncbi:hypothetical protein EJ08DRAFT_698261 [Tothia fuscella]|uniref:Uncharacterized protein n=1 Tax=Tothia fuscella TaxID=1048955 RepID=A0A9P4TXF0_9PEZI|nr:hypothetical protein EJ08DRAFT_698261 [Tothia fuscella]